MNLFTTYTPEETQILLSLTNNKYTDVKKEVLFLRNMHDYQIDRFVKKIELKELPKKSIIEHYYFIYVVEGMVAVLKNNRVVKKLKKNDLFGLRQMSKNEKYFLVTLTEAKICFIEPKEDNLLFLHICEYLFSGECKNILI